MELIVDPIRSEQNEAYDGKTGILVRAKYYDNWIAADIADLDKASLLVWLKSRGGNNPWAEDTVGILLGHGGLHKAEIEETATIRAQS